MNINRLFPALTVTEMPMISSLKSARSREKRALIKEESEAQKLIQEDCGESLQGTLKYLMLVGKVLMNLEVKLGRLEAANEKLNDVFEQNKDTEGTDSFQVVLDEEAEFIDGVLTKISELKVIKVEVEWKRNELEATSNPPHAAIASIWTQPSQQGPIKPQHIEIAPFDGNVLEWQEFWDQFKAAIHNGTFSSIDKMNYLKSKLMGEALNAISGYQLCNNNYEVVVDVLKRL